MFAKGIGTVVDTSITFGVITRVPPPDEFGNMALDLDVRIDPQAFGLDPIDTPMKKLVDLGLPPTVMLYVRHPVFFRGELLILDRDGREVASKGRKPSKWAVDYREFATIEEAIGCMRALSAEDEERIAAENHANLPVAVDDPSAIEAQIDAPN